MSQKERTRLGVMQQIKKEQTSLVAAEVLRLSYRQVRRIWPRYEQSGDRGLLECFAKRGITFGLEG